MGLVRRWANMSIGRKLSAVIGIMAVLIAGELITLRFAMRTLSAVRAFVGGEGLWSKAQKDAVLSLERYARTHEQRDYDSFLSHLAISDGDHRARVELQKPAFDPAIVRAGFLEGHIHPDDIEPMIELLRQFHDISYIARAIAIWTEADILVSDLRTLGEQYHATHALAEHELLSRTERLNVSMTVLENDFSNALAEGSRWLESIVLLLLTLGVVAAEAVGLTLAFLTSRAISRGLAELNWTAQQIGRGQLERTVPVRGNDEIGQLGRSLNEMGAMLRDSYKDLEERVLERTRELEKMATANALLYNQARAAVSARDEFISIASHELRNPLAPIVMAMQMMQLSGDNAFQRERAVIDRQVRHVVRLLDDLLDVAKITRGHVELKKERVLLSAVVASALEMAEPLLARRQHQVEVSVSDALWVDGDPTRLAQVVSNVVTNAAKYTAASGRIAIIGERDGVAVVLRIRDNGIGIAPEMMPRIFDLFVQARQAPDRSAGGLGLGLAIVHNLVVLHGGTVTAHSDGPGMGSEFVIRLPASVADERRAGPAKVTSLTTPGGRSHHVLAVDDNADALEMLGECLKLLGHEPHFAADGPAAIALAAKVRPTVAVLDIGLPVMDGFELARRIRQLPGLSNIKLIALTGYGHPSDRERTEAAGFDAHLVKPINASALQEAIDAGEPQAAGRAARNV